MVELVHAALDGDLARAKVAQKVVAPLARIDDGPVQVYAPQHTHPHPCFSPDGRRVVFSSDRTGHTQVYECVVDESWLEDPVGE